MLREVVIFLLKNTMTALMLAVGLATTGRMVRETWAERRMVLRGLLVLELGVPLLALATVKSLPMDLLAVRVIAVMAVCPGAPMIVGRVRGRAVMLVLLALVSILAPITVTVWVTVLDRALAHELEVSPIRIAEITLLKQVLPLAIGVAIASLLPRVARGLARVAWGFFFVGLSLALVLALVKGGPTLLEASPWAVLALLVVVAGSISMGHVAGRPRVEDSRALAVMAVLGNPALGAAVFTESEPSLRAGAVIAAYVIARALALLPYSLAVKQGARRARKRVEGGSPGVWTPPSALPGH